MNLYINIDFFLELRIIDSRDFFYNLYVFDNKYKII